MTLSRNEESQGLEGLPSSSSLSSRLEGARNAAHAQQDTTDRLRI